MGCFRSLKSRFQNLDLGVSKENNGRFEKKRSNRMVLELLTVFWAVFSHQHHGRRLTRRRQGDHRSNSGQDGRAKEQEIEGLFFLREKVKQRKNKKKGFISRPK